MIVSVSKTTTLRVLHANLCSPAQLRPEMTKVLVHLRTLTPRRVILPYLSMLGRRSLSSAPAYFPEFLQT